jgi:SpoU rRNA Methylase family
VVPSQWLLAVAVRGMKSRCRQAGVSAEVLEEADACAVVPMVGMVESLNVSVAAALMLHEARRGRVAALVRVWQEHAPDEAVAGRASIVTCPRLPADVMQLWR